MASIPSSPSKRLALSSKSSNVISSPFNTNKKSASHQITTTTNSTTSKSHSPTRKQPKLAFSIWEDKPSQPETTNDETKSNDDEPLSNKQNHHDQENILQPRKHDITRSNPMRKPLSPLNINEYQGFITYSHSNTAYQLTQLYQPPNFNNQFKSLHKKLNLPSFATPSRRNRDKYLVKSTNSEEQDSPFFDETELYLIKKQQQNTIKTNLIRKHTRSLSVGKNDSKLRLIRKNNFTILSS